MLIQFDVVLRVYTIQLVLYSNSEGCVGEGVVSRVGPHICIFSSVFASTSFVINKTLMFHVIARGSLHSSLKRYDIQLQATLFFLFPSLSTSPPLAHTFADPFPSVKNPGTFLHIVDSLILYDLFKFGTITLSSCSVRIVPLLS